MVVPTLALGSTDGGDGKPNGSSPLRNGVVVDWNGFEACLQRAYQEHLERNPSEQPLLLVDNVATSDSAREKAAELAFETFGVPAYFVGYDLVMSIYSAGRTSGIVFDVGAACTQAVAVVEGFATPHTLMHSDIGGEAATSFLLQALADRGHPLSRSTCEQLKEAHAYCALDFVAESVRLRSHGLEATRLRLPDGKEVDVGDDLIRCGEVLLQPAMAGSRAAGLSDMLSEIAATCMEGRDAAQMKLLPSFMLGVGGGSFLPGLGQRLAKDILDRRALATAPFVSCLATPDRWHAAWVGGSLVASLPSFVENNFVAKAEYEETGRAAVHTRC